MLLVLLFRTDFLFIEKTVPVRSGSDATKNNRGNSHDGVYYMRRHIGGELCTV